MWPSSAAQRLVMRGEGFAACDGADIAVVFRLDVAALIFLDAAALLHPGDARARKAGIDVDGDVGIGVGAGGVIDRQVGLAGAFAQHDLAQRHAQIGRLIRRDEDLARGGQRAGGHGGKLVSGLERMFMGSSCNSYSHSGRTARSVNSSCELVRKSVTCARSDERRHRLPRRECGPKWSRAVLPSRLQERIRVTDRTLSSHAASFDLSQARTPRVGLGILGDVADDGDRSRRRRRKSRAPARA